jgi:S1-C subfamily serine protease
MTGAAGRVLLGGQDAGSGFAITDSQVLTAGHVVRDAARSTADRRHGPAGRPGPVLAVVVDRGEPAGVPVVVEYQPEDGEPIPVTRIEVSSSLDVAVLHLQRAAPATLPVGPVTTGAEWRVETRPKASDPTLTGTVTDLHRRL